MMFRELIRALFKTSYSWRKIGIARVREGFDWKKTVKLATFIALLGLAGPGAVPQAQAEAECSGCICPGNPCKLCPLPPVKNGSAVSQEADTCRKIQEKVPPVSKHTEPNEHYASLNRSIMECVRNGGDVLMNSRRSTEFPSKHYCKPYIPSSKADTAKGR
ncbi:MAG TPA: hypothetical protein VFI43_07385 [Nitrosospira sp.]|nr:hypothetical protein [Nitrosospira sp.]